MKLVLRKFREERGLTQEELAVHLGKDRSTLAHYELGDINIPSNVLIAMAKFFGVSLSDLYEEDAPEPVANYD